MWWYRDPKRSPVATKPTPVRQRPAAPARADLAPHAAHVLEGRPKDPDAWLLMSLLVDSRIELTDGSVSDGMSWLDAERTLATAIGTGDPLRLYNRFSRDFGDGYTARTDLPKPHRDALAALRDALARSPGVVAVRPRSVSVAAATAV
jgi:hypothetical protein